MESSKKKPRGLKPLPGSKTRRIGSPSLRSPTPLGHLSSGEATSVSIDLAQGGTWRSGGKILALPQSLPNAVIISEAVASKDNLFSAESRRALGPTDTALENQLSGGTDGYQGRIRRNSYVAISQSAGISAKRGIRLVHLPTLEPQFQIPQQQQQQPQHLGGGGGEPTNRHNIASRHAPPGHYLGSGNGIPRDDVVQAPVERGNSIGRLKPAAGTTGSLVGVAGHVDQDMQDTDHVRGHDHKVGIADSDVKGHEGNYDILPLDKLTSVSRKSRLSVRTGHSSAAQSLEAYRRSRIEKASAKSNMSSWPNPDKYCPKSFCILSLENPLRRSLIKAIEWKWWDRIVMLVILLNTLQLCFIDPLDSPETRINNPVQRDVLELLGQIFSGIFMVECFCKLVALGFFWGSNTYLSEAWNWLDFAIVILGILDFVPDSGDGDGPNLSALRSLRVLRPLRAINKFPSLKFLATLLLDCLPMLGNVIGLLFFAFFAFGILGVQLYNGTLRGMCASFEDGTFLDDRICGSGGGGMSTCPSGYECLELGINPGMGQLHFDDIGAAMVVIFQIMTLEGWNDVMYDIQDVTGYWSFLYFVVLVFVGPIFGIQLFLVVISNKYTETKVAERMANEKMRSQEKALRMANATETAKNGIDAGAGAGADAAEDAPIKSEHPWRSKQVQGVQAQGEASGREGGRGGSAESEVKKPAGFISRIKTSSQVILANIELWGNQASESVRHISRRNSSVFGSTFHGNPNQLGMSFSEHGLYEQSSHGGEIGSQPKKKKRHRSRWMMWRWRLRMFAKSERLTNTILGFIIVNTIFMMMDFQCDFCHDPAVKGVGFRCSTYKGVLESSNLFFAFVFLFELLVKLIGLGAYKYFSSVMNLLDCFVVVTSLIELPGVIETSRCYFAPAAPTEDCFFSGSQYEACSGGPSMSVLRTFRLVRIVKLLKAFPNVQKQVAILVNVLGSVASLNVLMSIFLIIFCLMGMSLFGGVLEAEDLEVAWGAIVRVILPDDPDGLPRYAKVIGYNATLETRPWQLELRWGAEMADELGLMSDGTIYATDEPGTDFATIVSAVPRLNWDTFFVALATTFDILTLANWNDVRVEAIATTGYALNVYFALLIIVGNWMLLNLFIAIIVQGFAEQRAEALLENIFLMQERINDELGYLSEEELSERLSKLFNAIDVDGSGFIDRFELGQAFEDLGIKFTQKDIAQFVQKYDEDGSGSIDFQEFFMMISEILGQAKDAIAQHQGKGNVENDVAKDKVSEGYGMKSLDSMPNHHTPMMDQAVKRRTSMVLNDATEAQFRINNPSPVHVPKSPGMGTSPSKKPVSPQRSHVPSPLQHHIRDNSLSPDKKFRGMKGAHLPPPLTLDPASTGHAENGLLPPTPEGATADMTNLISPDLNRLGSAPTSPENVLSSGVKRLGSTGGFVSRVGSAPTSPENVWNAGVKRVGSNGTPEFLEGQIMTPKKGGDTASLAGSSIARRASDATVVYKMALDHYEVDHAAKVQKLEEEAEMAVAPRVAWMLPTDSAFSRLCMKVSDSSKWQNFILACIFTSCVCLAVENPSISSESQLREALDGIDVVMNLCFLAECLLKIFGMTFVAYIADGWNKLDFLIVSTSMTDLIMTRVLSGVDVDISVFKIFRIFRIFRALRPLRIIARAKGLKLLVSTLLSAVKPVINTTAIAGSAFSVLGVLGMQLLGGKMRYCSDSRIHYKKDCRGFTDDGDPILWLNQDYNFDNMYRALRTIFILSTQDDWPVHMWAGVDAVDSMTGPYQGYNLAMMIFYCTIIVSASYLIVNIFVGVFVDCYTTASVTLEVETNAAKAAEQASTATSMAEGGSRPRLKLNEVYDDPQDKLRKIVCRVVSTTAVDMLVAACIVLNVVLMGMESYKPASWSIHFGEIGNAFFSFVFAWEAFFKIYGYYPRRYFASNWNRFDFFIVMVTFVGFIIETSSRIAAEQGSQGEGGGDQVMILRIFRIFRILRAVRIFRTAKGLYAILMTMMTSLPALVNLLLMLALLFFVYSVLTVMLFGRLCSSGDTTLPGIMAVRCTLHDPELILDDHANFANLPNALLSLFRVATGDAWGEILTSLSTEAPLPRIVSDDAWDKTVDLLGRDPSSLDPADPGFFTRSQPNATLLIAMAAIRGWNASSFGMDQQPAWPLVSDQASDWISLARLALPVCVTDDEMLALTAHGLADCGRGVECGETCGSPLFANVSIITFVLVAAFVLLQLVIAVLMEQLARQFGVDLTGKAHKEDNVVGCTVLKPSMMARICRRWLYQAERKLSGRTKIKIKHFPPRARLHKEKSSGTHDMLDGLDGSPWTSQGNVQPLEPGSNWKITGGSPWNSGNMATFGRVSSVPREPPVQNWAEVRKKLEG